MRVSAVGMWRIAVIMGAAFFVMNLAAFVVFGGAINFIAMLACGWFAGDAWLDRAEAQECDRIERLLRSLSVMP